MNNELITAAQNVIWKLNRNEADGLNRTKPAAIDRDDVVIRELRQALESASNRSDNEGPTCGWATLAKSCYTSRSRP